MERELGVTRSVIDEPRSAVMVKGTVNVALLDVLMMNFILRIIKEIKWQVKVVLLGVSLMNLMLQI